MKNQLRSAITTVGRRMAGARSLWRANGMKKDLVPELGQGIIWDRTTVVITAILAVATFVYMLCVFFKTDLSAADGIYTK